MAHTRVDCADCCPRADCCRKQGLRSLQGAVYREQGLRRDGGMWGLRTFGLKDLGFAVLGVRV